MAFDRISPIVSSVAKSEHGTEDDKRETENGRGDRLVLSSRDASYSSGDQPREAAPELAVSLTSRRLMSFIAMALLWTASQIPLYLFGKPASTVETGVRTYNLCSGHLSDSLRRYWRHRQVDLVCDWQPTGLCCHLPVQWCAIRPSWTKTCGDRRHYLRADRPNRLLTGREHGHLYR